MPSPCSQRTRWAQRAWASALKSLSWTPRASAGRYASASMPASPLPHTSASSNRSSSAHRPRSRARSVWRHAFAGQQPISDVIIGLGPRPVQLVISRACHFIEAAQDPTCVLSIILNLSKPLWGAGERPVCGGRIHLPHIYRRQPHDHRRGHVLHGRPGPGRALQGKQLKQHTE